MRTFFGIADVAVWAPAIPAYRFLLSGSMLLAGPLNSLLWYKATTLIGLFIPAVLSRPLRCLYNM